MRRVPEEVGNIAREIRFNAIVFDGEILVVGGAPIAHDAVNLVLSES